MRLFRYLIFCVVVSIYSTLTFAQLDSVYHQGPAAGSVASGVMVTLNPNTFQPESPIGPRIVERNKIEPDFGEMIIETDESKLPPYVYTEDANATNNPTGASGQTVLLNKFESIPMTNSIPPDPHLAVGPNHIIACVNSRFAVYDKEGNQLANIDADNWISPVITSGAFDPQILYDHYEGRWFMLWDWQDNGTQQGYFIISYTDDDDPFGTWYMYLMDAKVNGTINSGTWGDYPQIGYDDEAIFINSRSFSFGGGYFYNRLRILDKSQLYASNGGQVNWTDFWDIRTPGQGTGGQQLDVIHPVYSYTPGSGSYFLWANRGGANYYCLFQILNPLSATPRLRGKVISTQFYGQTPNANQLGGGTPLIETNGSHMKTQPVLRDGKIFFAHSIRNSTNATYASTKYGIYDLGTETIIEQAEQGAVGYFYFYPTIAVDQDLNIAVTYSRSADTEYAGAFYSSKQASDPPGLEPSQPIEEGHGNYIVTFSGTRNRWGDYLGICVDPSDFYSVFMLSEFARNTNQWGTYIAEVRMAPYTGAHAYAESFTVNLGDLEVGTGTVNKSITLSNYGENDLVIDSVSSPIGPFTLLTSLSYPYTLVPYDSIDLEFEFNPADPVVYQEMMTFSNNDPDFPGFQLLGRGFEINEAFSNYLYAASGDVDTGKTILVDRAAGSGIELGGSNYPVIRSLAINPVTNIMYGTTLPTQFESEIVRVNSTLGDAYNLFTLDIPLLVGLGFTNTGDCYGATQTGDIYSIDLTNGTYNLEASTSIQITSITIDPVTNEMWATPKIAIGSTKDRIYKIDYTTGDATLIGETGFNVTTNALAFDEDGILFGVIGSPSEMGELISINTADGTGTMIGSTGYLDVEALAYTTTGDPLSADDNNNVNLPNQFALLQNFPNPFNPSTKIEFAIPVQSEVQLNIYNILGQKVKTLFEGELQAGNHNFTWNADDTNGKKLSSGIYFYELKATGNNGTDFQNTKKMLLLK